MVGIMTVKQKYKVFIVFFTLALFVLISCDEEKTNPVPVLNNVSPDTAVFNYGDLELTISGSNFINDSKIIFNGMEIETEYISATELNATVPASIFITTTASSGEDEQYPIQAENPAPGGGTSNTINLTGTFSLEFTSPMKITSNTDSSTRPAIAIDSNENIYITYHNDATTKYQIKFTRSTDGGQTFTTPVTISTTSIHSQNPAIAAFTSGNQNYVFVTWSQLQSNIYQIYLTRSTDGGVTFEPPVNLSSSKAGATRSNVALDSAGNLYIAWHDDRFGPSEIMLRKSTDFGATFQSVMRVTSNGIVSLFPYIAFDRSNNVLISWYQLTNKKYDVFFAKSTTGGDNFTNRNQLSETDCNSRFPKIIVDQNNVYHYFWQDDYPYINQINRIYYRKSVNEGASFTKTEIITDAGQKSERPIPMVDSFNNLNLVYTSDRRNNTFELYFTRSTDSGVSFPVTQRLTTFDGAQFARAATAPDGTVYIAWHSRIVGNRDIFFCKSTN
jgi:hypothetical protein